MADTIVRKSLYFSEDLWAKIEDLRFEQRIKSEAEVVRLMVEAGLYVLKLREDPIFQQAEYEAVERLNNRQG